MKLAIRCVRWVLRMAADCLYGLDEWLSRFGKKGWAVHHIDSAVHVMPVRDLIVHDFNDDCVCGPKVAFGDDEPYKIPLVTHHSLDGRETSEHPRIDWNHVG